MNGRSINAAIVLGIVWFAAPASADVNLGQIQVVADPDGDFEVPAQVLIEEIERRTGITWPLVSPEVAPDRSQITFRTSTADVGREGFEIRATSQDGSRMDIAALNRRGALFAVGFLLRHLHCSPGNVTLAESIDTLQKPEYVIRGHQLGYRAQANSYDAWDPAMFDQYIRELALFGTNCVENIPFQDERPTPIMPVSRPEMNRAMGAICDKYDVDYWVWTPADFDLRDQARRAAAIEFHEAFYQDCPRLDAIFFPGGDPGDNHPADVLPFLADLAPILETHHPGAKIWMSLQGFEGEKTDYVFEWLDKHQPDWLGGLVGGPSSPPLPNLRARLNPQYQLRDYPDITHIVRCQHEEENLDQVFALTAGREPINPRPLFYANVFAATAPHTNGFLSYSDGCQDDVNKALWSGLAWNSQQAPRDILVEYATCFFGAQQSASIADGILELEQNWNGALRDNAGVPKALARWQGLEAAHPELQNNWRWQMLLTRAYYDAYQQERLAYETQLEQDAYSELNADNGRTPTEAIRAARAVLARAESEPTRPDLRNRLVGLFDDLYSTIKFQSSVEKYHAIHPQRGCMLDFLDYPLNNRYWLDDEFNKVLTLPTLEARWDRLTELKNWENPGPGSFYDDIGNVGQSPHVVRDLSHTAGNYWWVENGMSRRRLSWLVTGHPASLEYDQLDPQGTYVLKFSGFGDLKPRGDGESLTATRYETDENTFMEFPVPAELLKDGKLSVTFDSVYLAGVNWRRQPRLAEAWLIKKQVDR